MTCCDSRTRCCSYWRIIQSCLGIFAGLSAGYVFYKNYGALEAAVWAIISAIFAIAALHLAILLHKKTVVRWYSDSHLRNIQLMAFFLSTVSAAFFFWYIFDAAYYRIPMMPVDHSSIVTSVWAFMTSKWTFLVWYFAKLGIQHRPLDYESLSTSES